MSRRILISSFWPIVLLLLVALGFVGQEFVRDCLTKTDDRIMQRTRLAVMGTGLQRSLPFALVVTFVLVPSIATRIFRTFLCDPFEYDHTTHQVRRFLHDDLMLSCDSDEYRDTHTTALCLVFLWPVG